MTPEEIRALSLIDVRDKIAAGELTSVEVTEATLEQAERFGQSHALFTTYAPEMAREMAKAADEARAAGKPLGALHGVPTPINRAVQDRVTRMLVDGTAPRSVPPAEIFDLARSYGAEI